MQLIYFLDNKLGGVTSLNYNLASNPLPEMEQIVIHIDMKEWAMTRSNQLFPADKELYFEFSGNTHSYKLLRELRKLVPENPGAMVLNYENEMAMLDHYPVQQTTYQLVHDDYNVRLAEKYGHVVDVFIAHNTTIYQKLLHLFPGRPEAVFYLAHGVSIPGTYRQQDMERKKLKLLFLGRMTTGKGIFDLPVISQYLREAGILFEWVCVGNGPEFNALKQKWGNSDEVTYLSPPTNKEVMQICAEQDVFVLPTKFEGSPVSLIETMSAGLVPVITKLPGGITDIVSADIGFAVEIDNNRAFADAIICLYNDRVLLNRLSVNCRQKVINQFDVTKTARNYHQLFARYKEFYHKKEIKKLRIGARLDHPLIPAIVTRLLRRSEHKF